MTISLPAPSDEQWRAIQEAKKWFETGAKPGFSIFGPAGSGKSTLLRHLLVELGLTPGRDVVILTLLGKASDVLRRKGLPSVTIHSFLYQPSIVPPAVIENLRRRINAGEIELREQLRRLLSPSFKLRDVGPLEDIKLLVIDEVSMVPDSIMDDLKALGIKILKLGDPFQLKPVGSNCTEILVPPDVMLTEVHRQALENPILRFATKVREEGVIEEIKTDQCYITNEPLIHLPDFLAANFDIGICGYHRTRHRLNRDIRTALGHLTVLPNENDKLICVKNRKVNDEQQFFNGQAIRLSNIGTADPLVDKDFSATAGPEQGDWTSNEMVYIGHFLDHYAYDRDRAERDYQYKLTMNPLEADYAYAITGHKSQGSEWPRVFVIHDEFGRTPDDQIRWLYTAATRAMDQLVVSTQRI